MVECDLIIREPRLERIRVVGEYDEFACTSSHRRELHATREFSRALASPSFFPVPPVYSGLCTSKRRHLGMLKIGKPLRRESSGRAEDVKVHSSGFVRALEAVCSRDH